jgi:hypothetical protein
MRFLRMFTNSLLAGGLGAAYLTVLVLQLNPHVPLLSGTTWRWFATLAVFYGLHLAVAFYVLIVVREFFSMDAMSPGWASVRVLAWLSATGAAVAAAMMWLNANSFRAALGDHPTRRMMAGAVATTLAAVVLLGIALAHYSSRKRGSRVGGALFAIAVFASLVLPLAARGPAVSSDSPLPAAQPPATRADGGPRVMMLLLDGASLEYIRTRASEGRLPHLSKLLESGASMYLAALRPTQPGPIWAAAATGMYPAKNGVRSAALYYARGDNRPIYLLPDHCFSHALVHFGAIRAEPNSSAAWRARPLWSILTNAGVESGFVRHPLTHPASPVLGFLLTDRFHEVPGAMAPFDARVGYPSDVLAVGASVLEEGDAAPSGPRSVPEIAETRRDRRYLRALRQILGTWAPRVVALRLQALDAAGHLYYDDGQASAFRDGTETERRDRAQRLERAYSVVDAEVGAAIDALAPGDLLVVVSGFGMQRLNPVKELIARALGDADVRGTHERAPDGFLLAYGEAVQPGRLPRGSIVDVTPSILYFLGLPVGRDMDGFARTDLFTPAFTAERPIAFIATHSR